MAQVRLDPANLQGDRFTIRGPEAHHLIRVLRKKAGDEIQLFDGQGRQYVGIVHRIDLQKLHVEGRIKEALEVAQKTAAIALYQGLPRGSKFDYVLEKAVELGIDEVHPFLSEKSPIRLEPSERSSKNDRWNRLVEAAAKQCNRPDLPRVGIVKDFNELKWDKMDGLVLAFVLDPRARDLKSFFLEHHKDGPATRYHLVIGPESDFSKQEVDQLAASGAVMLSLGKSVLRTETAGLVAASILRYEMGLL